MALEAIMCSTPRRVLMPMRCERCQPSKCSAPSKKLQLCPEVYPEQVMATASRAPALMLGSMREKSRRRASRLSSGRLSSIELRRFLSQAPKKNPASQRPLLAATPGKSER